VIFGLQRVLPKIFNEEGGAQQDSGENARLSSFVGSIAIADLVKSTLGPKGMDKILISTGEGWHSVFAALLFIIVSQGPSSGKVTVTNDGATILKSLPIDNAAAKILVDISKTQVIVSYFGYYFHIMMTLVQDTNVGDGTTSVVVLAGALIREAERLIEMKIHPQTIVRGWRKAILVARKELEASALNHKENMELFRQDLLNIAKTTISSKILTQNKERFAEIAVEAVLRLKGNLEDQKGVLLR
jgi:T-complex protein 1 subunit beta